MCTILLGNTGNTADFSGERRTDGRRVFTRDWAIRRFNRVYADDSTSEQTADGRCDYQFSVPLDDGCRRCFPGNRPSIQLRAEGND